MLFPFRRHSSSSRVDEAIDRYRRSRPTRWMQGMQVAPDFGSIRAALVAARGSGKWLRPHTVAQTTVELPAAVREACLQTCGGTEATATTMNVGTDLAEAVAVASEQLLAVGGLSSADACTVCIWEPGIRWQDYDGRLEYASLFRPQAFVERTGLNVIDSLPAADIAGGGRGVPLEPLADWLLLADRRRPIAVRGRWLVRLESAAELLYLPPSDGLDAELPDIARYWLPGLGLLEDLYRTAGKSQSADDPQGTWAVQGRRLPELSRYLSECWPTPERILVQPEKLFDEWRETTLLEIRSQMKKARWSWLDVICTATRCLTEQLIQALRRHETTVDAASPEVLLAGRGRANRLVFADVAHAFGDSNVRTIDDLPEPHAELTDEALHPTEVAVLGLMHVDQMPASLPWLTGCEVPRLHGRVTPGRPAHWRQLLNDMADYHPPAMKLREAV